MEDSSDDVFIFRRVLARTGIKTELSVVGNGTEAVEYLKAVLERRQPDKYQLPHIVFLDLKLPLLSGFEVLRWLRQQPFAPRLFVVVLTGSDEERDKRLVTELGADEFVTKPINAERLSESLTRSQ